MRIFESQNNMNMKNSILLLSLAGMLAVAACKKDNHVSFVTTLPGNYSCTIYRQGYYYGGSFNDSLIYYDSIIGTGTISVTRAKTNTGVIINGVTFNNVDSVIGNTASYVSSDSSFYYQAVFYNTGDSIYFSANNYYSSYGNYYSIVYEGHKVQ